MSKRIQILMIGLAVVIYVAVAVVAVGGGAYFMGEALKATFGCVPASTRIAGTPGDPAIKQIVVWENRPEARAHYLNLNPQSDPARIQTACGEIIVADETWKFGSIEQMEAERRIPCADCIRALERYVNSMNARKRNDLPY